MWFYFDFSSLYIYIYIYSVFGGTGLAYDYSSVKEMKLTNIGTNDTQ